MELSDLFPSLENECQINTYAERLYEWAATFWAGFKYVHLPVAIILLLFTGLCSILGLLIALIFGSNKHHLGSTGMK